MLCSSGESDFAVLPGDDAEERLDRARAVDLVDREEVADRDLARGGLALDRPVDERRAEERRQHAARAARRPHRKDRDALGLPPLELGDAQTAGQIGGARDELDRARAGRAHRRDPGLPVRRQRKGRVQRDDDPLALRKGVAVAEQAPRVLDVHRRSRLRRPRRRAAGTPPADPEKLPPSASERHVRMTGRGSSAASAAAGIGSRARSIRNSIAFAPAGTRATRRCASAASLGASDAMCAGIGRTFLAMKIKNPRALSGRGFELSSFWFAPAESVGRAFALPGCLPPPPVPDRSRDRHRRRDHPARSGWCQGSRGRGCRSASASVWVSGGGAPTEGQRKHQGTRIALRCCALERSATRRPVRWYLYEPSRAHAGLQVGKPGGQTPSRDAYFSIRSLQDERGHFLVEREPVRTHDHVDDGVAGDGHGDVGILLSADGDLPGPRQLARGSIRRRCGRSDPICDPAIDAREHFDRLRPRSGSAEAGPGIVLKCREEGLVEPSAAQALGPAERPGRRPFAGRRRPLFDWRRHDELRDQLGPARRDTLSRARHDAVEDASVVRRGRTRPAPRS